MRMHYSEAIALQLVPSDLALNEIVAHMRQECERIANGFSSHANDWGVRHYGAMCDRQVGRAIDAVRQ